MIMEIDGTMVDIDVEIENEEHGRYVITTIKELFEGIEEMQEAIELQQIKEANMWEEIKELRDYIAELESRLGIEDEEFIEDEPREK